MKRRTRRAEEWRIHQQRHRSHEQSDRGLGSGCSRRRGLSGVACHDLELVISSEREVSSNRLLLLRPILKSLHEQVYDRLRSVHREDLVVIHAESVGNTGLKANSRASRLIIGIEKRCRIETTEISTEFRGRVKQKLEDCHEVLLCDRFGKVLIKSFNHDVDYRERLELLTSDVQRNETSRDVCEQLSVGQRNITIKG